MKRWLAGVITGIGLLTAVNVVGAEVNAQNPYLLMKTMADSTFSHLKANEARYKANPELLREVARTEVLPHINVRYAAMQLLGPLSNKATKQERDLFTNALEQYLIYAYAVIFTQYSDQKVIIEPPKPIDKDRAVISVRVEIIERDRPPIKLDFKLRKNRKTLDWQGYDVQVEGVSMLDAKASEWSGPLRQRGIEYVANQLIEQSKMPVRKSTTKG